MKRILTITRRTSTDETPYTQSFAYETTDERAMVATALTDLNSQADLRDTKGTPAAPIQWSCGCLQRKCGACAMLICDRPGLACNARLAELPEEVTLAPLAKFDVVADLVVDRTPVFERLSALEAWLESDAETPENRVSFAREASRCLQCGCCLEVCPNFSVQGSFAGMASGISFTRLIAAASREERGRLAQTYNENFYAGCGKSLACRNICPAQLDIDLLISRSNAAAVWKRY